MKRELDYPLVLNAIREDVKAYLIKYKIKSLIMGVSGGLDSGINCAILAPICKELDIPLIGRYIHIDSNKEDEREKANMIGKAFCTQYKAIDLTPLYDYSLSSIEEDEECDMTLLSEKIRRGNIKARLRMIYLYDLAAKHHGIVIDNDNMTEYLLGFYTISGDIGDLTPISDLFKTEVFNLCHYMMNITDNLDEKEALEAIFTAIPKDGLAITPNGDLDQIGCRNFYEVDSILEAIVDPCHSFVAESDALKDMCGEEAFNKVVARNKNSAFKRNHPYKVHIL